jgi:hypothetical protein
MLDALAKGALTSLVLTLFLQVSNALPVVVVACARQGVLTLFIGLFYNLSMLCTVTRRAHTLTFVVFVFGFVSSKLGHLSSGTCSPRCAHLCFFFGFVSSELVMLARPSVIYSSTYWTDSQIQQGAAERTGQCVRAHRPTVC